MYRLWTRYNYTGPSSEELTSASTIQDYYNLREPRSMLRSLDSNMFSEQAFPPVIAFFDRRIPALRNIFRHRFQETLLESGGSIDKKAVDRLIHEFYQEILPTVKEAMQTMSKNRKC